MGQTRPAEAILTKVSQYLTRAGVVKAANGAANSIVVTDTKDALDAVGQFLEGCWARTSPLPPRAPLTQAGATHFTQAGPRSPAVGLLTARGRDRRAKAKTRLYSAAAAFAQLHRHGTQIVCAALPEGNVWIAVVIDGTVQTGGDRVLAGAQAAHQALDGLIERYRDAVVHGTERPGALPFQFSQLATLANTQSSLRRASFRVSMISPIWWVVFGLVLAYLAWDTFQTWWHESQVIERQRLEDMRTAVDAHALWQQALANWAQSIRTDGEAGLTRLLDTLTQVPVNPGRWLLAEASC